MKEKKIKGQPLQSTLKDIISTLKQKEKEEGDFLKIWGDAVGVKTTSHTRLVSFKDKKLLVNVSDSTLLYTLTLDKNRIIKEMNKSLKGRNRIEEVQLRIGGI